MKEKKNKVNVIASHCEIIKPSKHENDIISNSKSSKLTSDTYY